MKHSINNGINVKIKRIFTKVIIDVISASPQAIKTSPVYSVVLGS
nr:MAG TPA: hypothetical protein [Caudoviricetes sp.]